MKILITVEDGVDDDGDVAVEITREVVRPFTDDDIERGANSPALLIASKLTSALARVIEEIDVPEEKA